MKVALDGNKNVFLCMPQIECSEGGVPIPFPSSFFFQIPLRNSLTFFFLIPSDQIPVPVWLEPHFPTANPNSHFTPSGPSTNKHRLHFNMVVFFVDNVCIKAKIYMQ